MNTIFKNYINTFRGLSTEVWWLALITLINRAGTMVIPFLSLYLTEHLDFSLKQVGWIMTAFGAGSLVGSWLGGKLTDQIGAYRVMTSSLILSGLSFIALQYAQTFESICLGIFILMIIADSFRPAMFVALSAYSKPENKTRSVTLIRLAINLGFSAGPALGGLIITSLGYSGLFWVDGITCISAAILLFAVLNPKRTTIQDDISPVGNPVSAYKDRSFLIFALCMSIFALVFLQYFSTIPLYYDNVHTLTKFEIGLLLGANGLFIFLLEMPLIKWLENTHYSKVNLMIFGTILLALSFFILNIHEWSGVLIIGMLLMTVGEMIVFPMSNAFALEKAKKGRQGQYMALYSIAFSFSHLFGHNSGMQLVDRFGFDNTWYSMVGLCVITILLFLLLKNIDKDDKKEGLKA